jgi:phasin family protein
MNMPINSTASQTTTTDAATDKAAAKINADVNVAAPKAAAPSVAMAIAKPEPVATPPAETTTAKVTPAPAPAAKAPVAPAAKAPAAPGAKAPVAKAPVVKAPAAKAAAAPAAKAPTVAKSASAAPARVATPNHPPAAKPVLQNNADFVLAREAYAALIKKGTIDMATNFNVTPEHAQALFGDINERAKAAFEKSSKLGEELVELTKGNVEAIVTSARVAAKGAEALAADAAEYSKKHFEATSSAYKSYAAVKSPTELFQLQSDFAKQSFDSAVAEASKFSESMLKLMGEIAQPLSSRYAVAAEKIKASTGL